MGMRRTSLESPLVLLCFVVVCIGVGRLSAYITAPAMEVWYPFLIKPAFTPPDWAFPAVWTLLYLAMAIAAWLVWKAGPRGEVWPAITLFLVQLVLNGVWSFLFFGLQAPGLALLELAVLVIAIVATIVRFQRHSTIACYLMMPYLLWVLYAGLLNFEIWRLNG